MLVFPFGLVYKQVLSFYFVFTVSSTVGFGDIYAMNTSERVIILFEPIMRNAVLKNVFASTSKSFAKLSTCYGVSILCVYDANISYELFF